MRFRQEKPLSHRDLIVLILLGMNGIYLLYGAMIIMLVRIFPEFILPIWDRL
jgi:hypothetical protein